LARDVRSRRGMLLLASSSERVVPAACTLDGANRRGRPLQEIVRRGWDALQATLADADRGLPGFVVREVERALSCGDPNGGFAWLCCPDGHHHRLVPFSCQTRVFCPSCGGRRMAERALQ
jgi:hypothetical protein